MAATVVALGLSLFQSAPAQAAPKTDPTNSADAKKAWLDAAHQAEVVNEQVLDAKIAEKKATAAALAAAAKVTATKAAVVKATSKVVASDAAVASYQGRIDQFANASFRGARLSQMTLLLTAHSADDFLDSATALDRVAADTQKTLAGAIASRAAAKNARTAADTAAAAAVVAEKDAASAEADAQTKTAAVTGKQADLKVQIADYKKLYNQLSEKERQEAIAAAEKARAEEAARQQAAAEEAARQQAEAEQAAADADAAAAAAAASEAEASRADRGAPRETPTDTPAGSATPAATSSAAPPAAPAPTTETSSSAPAAPAAPSSQAQIAVQAALSKVGAAYVYGAAGPDAFDCSGLVMWAWAQAGVSLPHSSGELSGYPSVPLDQLQPGDWVTYYSPVSHVALYIGNGQVVHASTESMPVYVTGVYDAGPDPSGHRLG